MFFYLENAHGCADCVNQRVNRVNHSKRDQMQNPVELLKTDQLQKLFEV